MLIIVNILVVVFATVAGCVALFGDTWDRSRSKLTHVGRLAVLCMGVVLALGITKEYLSGQKDAIESAELKKQQEKVQEGLQLLAIAHANAFRLNASDRDVVTTDLESLDFRGVRSVLLSNCMTALDEFASPLESAKARQNPLKDSGLKLSGISLKLSK